MERLTKIDGIGQNDLRRCFDCGPEKAGADLEHCGSCEEGWQRALDRLAAYEDTGLEPEDLKNEFGEDGVLKLAAQCLGTTADHLRELVRAENDGRLRILPASEGRTCGSCGHFKRIPGRNCGTCKVRPHYTDRRGHIDTHRGTFTPSQSRKCCKQYVPHEAALEGGDST